MTKRSFLNALDSITARLLPSAILLFCAVSYVLNIVKLVGLDDLLTGEGALRIVSLFTPLGAVAGYF